MGVSSGKAVRDSKLSRKDVWVTSKIWSSDWYGICPEPASFCFKSLLLGSENMCKCRGYQAAREAALESLQLMQFEYIDLMLLHSPGDPGLRPETWKALEDLHQEVSACWTAAFVACMIGCRCD